MALLRLWHGDCLTRLEELEDGSVGAFVCDPPYDLTQASRRGSPRPAGTGPFGRHRLGTHDHDRGIKTGGFMGKTWDATGIAFDEKFWLVVRRKLRPGGVVKAFGGTRTYHKMCRAMERAGLVDVRLEAWTYGCLDESSEILTETGWKLGTEVQQGELVMCWDPGTEALALMPVEEKTFAPFDGEMVRFVNDNTDQMLTPNHRVYKRHRIRQMRDGVRVTSFEREWVATEAAEINRWNTINLPLAGYHDGAGLDETPHYAEFLAWIWTEGGFDQTGNGVRISQSTRVGDDGHEHVERIDTLVSRLVPGHKHYTRERSYRGRPYTEHTWFFTGEMAERVRKDLPDKHPTYDLLWRMTLEEKDVFMWTTLCGDGSEGDKEFYQKDAADREWYQTLAHMMGWQARVSDKKNNVSLHENPQTQLQVRHLKKHDRERYVGDVWCVRVPTGAFVARHNGRIFITGNSGFPKSTNISKMIDKRAKAEREVVGYKRGVGGENLNDVVRDAEVRQTTDEGGRGVGAYGTGARQVAVDVPVTVPATELAKLWDGYGTMLKPAWEVVVVGRKP